MAQKVRSPAEATGRKFYIMYDVSGWTNMQPEIEADWTAKMAALTASTAYARQNGLPVVGIRGFGFNDTNHPWTAAVYLDVINWFKAQGCYIDTYHAFNMLSPWMVGRIGNAGDSDSFYANVNQGDQADCNAHGIDYQPCVLPGDLSQRQRAHGDFIWRQFYNMVRVGAQGIYISMFDEFNEGNQIAKTAETSAFVPTNSGMLALDEDGTACSADYYLRLTADGGRMPKCPIALSATRPTPVLDHRLKAVIGYMREHVNEPVNVEDVASTVNLSRAHLFSLFRDQLNTKPQVFWSAVRVEEAVRRLIHQEEPLTSGALALGFSTPGNFSRFFREHMGVSPSKFRRVASGTQGPHLLTGVAP